MLKVKTKVLNTKNSWDYSDEAIIEDHKKHCKLNCIEESFKVKCECGFFVNGNFFWEPFNGKRRTMFNRSSSDEFSILRNGFVCGEPYYRFEIGMGFFNPITRMDGSVIHERQFHKMPIESNGVVVSFKDGVREKCEFNDYSRKVSISKLIRNRKKRYPFHWHEVNTSEEDVLEMELASMNAFPWFKKLYICIYKQAFNNTITERDPYNLGFSHDSEVISESFMAGRSSIIDGWVFRVLPAYYVTALKFIKSLADHLIFLDELSKMHPALSVFADWSRVDFAGYNREVTPLYMSRILYHISGYAHADDELDHLEILTKSAHSYFKGNVSYTAYLSSSKMDLNNVFDYCTLRDVDFQI